MLPVEFRHLTLSPVEAVCPSEEFREEEGPSLRPVLHVLLVRAGSRCSTTVLDGTCLA